MGYIRFIGMTLLLFGGSALGAACFRKRTEDTLALTLGATVFMLYVFYVLNLLMVGAFLVVALLALCYVWALATVLKRKSFKAFLNNLITPGAVTIFVLLIAYMIVTRGNSVLLWDEMRLWAAVPKAMYYTGELQLGVESLIYPNMQSYYPGMSLFLFLYEWAAANPFSEWMLFFAYSFFSGAMMLPVTAELRWEPWWKLIPVAFLLFLAPLSFFNSDFNYDYYYQTLYIDAALGIALAYSLWLAWKIEKFDAFETLRYAVSLAVLVLLKDSGVLFAFFSLSTALVLHGKKKNLPQFGTAIGAMILAAVPWKICLHMTGIKNHVSSPMAGFWEFLRQPSAEKIVITTDFWGTWVPKNLLIRSNFSGWYNMIGVQLSWAVLIVLFVMLGAGLAFAAKCERRTRMIKYLVMLLVINIVYLFSLYILFVGSFEGIASYERYEGTMMLATLLVLAFLCVESWLNTELIHVQRYRAMMTLVLCCVLVTMPIRQPAMPTWTEEEKVKGDQQTALVREQLQPNTERTDLFLLQTEENSLIHHRIYLNLIENNVYVKNFYSQVQPESVGVETAQEWLEYLRENGYECVYVENVDDEFLEEFTDAFEQPPKKETLYYFGVQGRLTASA